MVMLSPDLMNILACPACKGGVRPNDDGQRLICRSCGLAYPVRDGIPVMLVDEAVAVTDLPVADDTP
jgi:uncharacterized protein YbaR (Trm112 family)